MENSPGPIRFYPPQQRKFAKKSTSKYLGLIRLNLKESIAAGELVEASE